MVACHVEAGCNFEGLRRKQHAIGKIAELLSCLVAQGYLTHHSAHRLETVSLLAQSCDFRNHSIWGMGCVDAREEPKGLGGEECLELASFHFPILSVRHELALVLREC